MIRATNKIFYGPPGTGKTWRLVEESLALALTAEELDSLSSADKEARRLRFDELLAQGIIEFVTFHPSYSYEDFVEGLRPITTDDERVIYEVVPGVLRRIAARADLLSQEIQQRSLRASAPRSPERDAPPLHEVWHAFLEAIAQARAACELDGIISPLIQEQRSGRRVDYDVMAESVQVTSRSYELEGKVRKTNVSIHDIAQAWHQGPLAPNDVPKNLFQKYKRSSGHDTDIRLVYNRLHDFWRKNSSQLKQEPTSGAAVWSALVAAYAAKPRHISNVRPQLTIRGDGDLIIVSVAEESFAQKSLTAKELETWLNYKKINPTKITADMLSQEQLESLITAVAKDRPALALAARDIYETFRALYLNGAPPPLPLLPASCVLIIDEINRGNIAKIFGELLTILEPSRRLGAADQTRVRLPMAGEGVDALFGLPSNLHILGTMNTADRSIALMDVALRRRFEFVEVMPDPALLRAALPAPLGALAAAILSTLNERLLRLMDRDHVLGHAALMQISSQEQLRDWLVFQVIPLLQEYFYGDWARVALVLGCPFDAQGKPIDTRTSARILVPESGADADALFYGQWRDAASLRLQINPALREAKQGVLLELLLSILPHAERDALRDEP